MNADIKISVIVPIYNVADYIKQCVNSVMEQTYKNLEILLVDDGSLDKCPYICDQYQKQDSRIKVIHKTNGGLSDARNCGIQMATGDYVMFLDGDDYWDDPNALERLSKRIGESDVDVLNFSYKKCFEDTGKKISYIQNVADMPLEYCTKEQQLNYMMNHSLYIASACNKLIRRSLLDDTMLFVKGVYSEDIDWGARLLLVAESFDFVCENFYCYRQRKDSIRHTINNKKCIDLKNNIIKCIELGKKADLKWKKNFFQYAAFQYATFFLIQAQAENPQKECIEELSSYHKILTYHGNNRKVAYLYYADKIMGTRFLCKLIRLFYR